MATALAIAADLDPCDRIDTDVQGGGLLSLLVK